MPPMPLKTIMGCCRPEKKLSKKPRHLELQEVGLESPSTPAGLPFPADTPLGGIAPGQRHVSPLAVFL